MKTPRTPTNEDLKNIQPMLLQGFGDRSARSILVLDFRRASRMSDLSSASLLQCAVLSRSRCPSSSPFRPLKPSAPQQSFLRVDCRMNWLACALLRGSIATVMVLSSNPSQALLSSAYASLSNAWSSFVPPNSPEKEMHTRARLQVPSGTAFWRLAAPAPTPPSLVSAVIFRVQLAEQRRA